VSHTKLVHKLIGYGINDKLLNVIVNFLDHRSQRVVLPNGLSSFLDVTSGVPQGSVLGPLLFLLYINDVCDIFNSNTKIKLYADDIKIYLEIDNNSALAELQHDIETLTLWSEIWQLTLSVDKCFHIRFGTSNRIPKHVYSVNNVSLNSVTKLRDLGITVDNRLNFSSHIKTIAARAQIRANQVLRCFISHDRQLLTKAFITYVRPIVEYCSPVWNPHQITLINKLESVQRWYTKRLVGFHNFSYDERCKMLGLERLELRRLHADLIYCFNIIHDFTCLLPNDFFTLSGVNITRGNDLKLKLPVSRVDCRKHFFAVRIIHIWNSLPNDIVLSDNCTVFKKRLQLINLNNYLYGHT